MGGPETGVETALEADVDRHIPPATRSAICRVPGRSAASGFSQNVVSPRRPAHARLLGMRAGGCTDGDCVQACPEQGLDVGRGFETGVLGHGLGAGGVCVGDDHLLDGAQALERRSMERPDPAHSDQANAHAQTLPTTRLLPAGLSPQGPPFAGFRVVDH
jgi:hypothetical protein